jgi:hypothetical protein
MLKSKRIFAKYIPDEVVLETIDVLSCCRHPFSAQRTWRGGPPHSVSCLDIEHVISDDSHCIKLGSMRALMTRLRRKGLIKFCGDGDDFSVPYRHHLTKVVITDKGDRLVSIRRARADERTDRIVQQWRDQLLRFASARGPGCSCAGCRPLAMSHRRSSRHVQP